MLRQDLWGGCCNEGDTCFTNMLGASDCCALGRQKCPPGEGQPGQCCKQDQVCNGITGDCCGAGTELCGSAGCCATGTCNNNPRAPACCPGRVDEPGGRCGVGSSLGCCPREQTCNPTTGTCCTGQPCGAIGCCEPGHCNGFLCCPGAFGQPEGPCNGIGVTPQHCCPPGQICVNAEFIAQPAGCCPDLVPRIQYHGCFDNHCCQHPCDSSGRCN